MGCISMYDIYLDRYLLPLTPEKIQISSKNKNDVVKLINDAEINILKQEGLKEITFDFILPAYNYPFANFRFGYEKPQHFLSKLERLKKEARPFQFIIVRQYPNNKNYFNTNLKVSLEDYDVSDNVNEFMDITVSVKLKQYKNPRSTTLELLEDKLGAYITMPRGITKIIDRIYTTKAGEMLWQICRAETGGLEQLGQIMNNNMIPTLNSYLPEVLKIGDK